MPVDDALLDEMPVERNHVGSLRSGTIWRQTDIFWLKTGSVFEEVLPRLNTHKTNLSVFDGPSEAVKQRLRPQ